MIESTDVLPTTTTASTAVGRRSVLTPDATRRFMEAIRVGASMKTAAKFAGVSARTVYRHLQAGRAGEGDAQVEFLQEYDKARADREVNDLAVVEKAARDGNWQASVWRLERLDPERYGRRLKIESKITQTNRAELEITHRLLADPRVMAALDAVTCEQAVTDGSEQSVTLDVTDDQPDATDDQ